MHTRFDTIFRISIILKGLDALAELLGGAFLLIITPHQIHSFVHWLTAKELAADPHDFVANIIVHSSHKISTTSTTYGAIYLLIHGLIKMFVIVNVLRDKYWAYPLLIVVLFGFIIYQVIDIVQHHSITMALLSAFDLLIIILTWLEWQKRRALKRAEEESDLAEESQSGKNS